MKNIITIDFDIIMAPCIELYNNMVPDKSWEELQEIPQIHTLTADLQLYQRLTEYLLKIKKQISIKNVHFVENHEFISYFVYPNEEITVYNIDHHHDCGYDKEEGYSELTCANWVYYLKKFSSKFEYYWICNTNSNFPQEQDLGNELINYHYFIGSFNFDQLPIPDELVIVLSPEWVPPNFYPLYSLWDSMFEFDKKGEK